jgi:hypothetical protein
MSGLAMILFLGAMAILLSGCSEPFTFPAGSGDGAGSGSGSTELSLQQVPSGSEEVRLSVSGPEMEPVTRTLDVDSPGVYLDIPRGEDRVFRAEAGYRAAEKTVDVPAGGTSVRLALALVNIVEFGETTYRPDRFVIQESLQEFGNIGNRSGRGFYVRAVPEDAQIEDTGLPKLADGDRFFQIGIVSESSMSGPSEGEYTVQSGEPDSPGYASVVLGLDYDASADQFGQTVIASEGTVSVSVKDGVYRFRIDASTQEGTGLSGALRGDPEFYGVQ